MIQTKIALLPEVTLMIGMILMLIIGKMRKSQTAKTFYTITKYTMILALTMTIALYNRSHFSAFFMNTYYTTLFKVLVYIAGLAWFYLSCKWFLTKDKSSEKFYVLGLFSVLLLTLAISSINLGSLFICLNLAFVINAFLVRLNDSNEEAVASSNRFLIASAVLLTINVCGLYLLYNTIGSLDYAKIQNFFVNNSLNFNLVVALSCIFASLFYIMGFAPFHSWFADTVSKSILPVSGYLTLIPLFAYFISLINLTANVFWPLHSILHQIFIIIGSFSIIFGVIGANGETNLRKIFAYSTIFHIGVMLMVLAAFNDASVFTSFVYLLTYSLSMFGVYTVFFAFKSKGDYLLELKDIAGISDAKTYVSAAFLIFVISLVGTPPLLGFFGRVSLANTLISNQEYYITFFIFIAFVLLFNAYLKIIKVIYFDDLKSKFDRVDKGTYICLLVNLILVIFSILNPEYLMHDFEKILAKIF